MSKSSGVHSRASLSPMVDPSLIWTVCHIQNRPRMSKISADVHCPFSFVLIKFQSVCVYFVCLFRLRIVLYTPDR